MPRKKATQARVPRAPAVSERVPSPQAEPPAPALGALAGLHPDLLKLLGSSSGASGEVGASQEAPAAQEGEGAGHLPPPAVSPEPELVGDDRINTQKMAGQRLDNFAHQQGVSRSEIARIREVRGDQADPFIRAQADMAFRRRYAEA